MKIELYSAQKLSQKGSSLKKLIQNNDMPVLDLLVRESIQNSLDAKDESSDSKFVRVDYNYGSFDRDALDKELDGIDLSRKPLWGNQFLSVSDRFTVGLTGSYKDKSSNLYRLIFGIMDAQQASGAGGSWGIGKTVYFRVGVGLVIYYSRIKTEDGYESLMAAALVEDETQKSSLLPAVEGQKYGIAWWGQEISSKTHTVRETRKIRSITRVLSAFGLQPYKGNDTGTVIIIPFINEQDLLANNQPERKDGEPAPFWMSSLKDYLCLSVQKWYSARLNNRRYQHGKYLTVSVNGKVISPDDVEPFFKLTQQLYNKAALTISGSPDAQSITFANASICSIEIRIYSEIAPNEAGQVAYVKVNRKQLGMTPPDNKPSPYEYINQIVDDEDYGKPILMFCRKPGMVVSYKTEGRWVDAIPKTMDDEYIVAFFVLNPQPGLTTANISLEDYVRKSEMADHSSWEDCAIESHKPTIITKIRKRVSRKLGNVFENTEEISGKKENTGLGTLLGRILLPPEGFGRKPSSPQSSSESGNKTATYKSVKYKYGILRYTPTGMLLQIKISTGKNKVNGFGFSMEMDSIKGAISPNDWETEMGLSLPFCIDSIQLSVKKVDGIDQRINSIVRKDGDSQQGGVCLKQYVSKGGDWYGSSFCFADDNGHSVDMELLLDVMIRRKDIKPVMSFE